MLVDQQDPVGLALFDAQPRQCAAAATQAQLAPIVGVLEQAQPDRETDWAACSQTLSEQIKQRGLMVIFSDLLTDLDAFYDGLARLQYRGHEIMVMHVLDRDELELPFNDLVMFRDIEGRGRMLAEPWAFRKAYPGRDGTVSGRKCAALLRQAGIDYLLLRPTSQLADAFRHYLHARDRLRRLQNHKGRR